MASSVVLINFFLYAVGYNIFGVLASNIIEGCNISLTSAGMLQSMFQIGAFTGIALSPLALKKLSSKNIARLGIILDVTGMASIFILKSALGVFAGFILMGFGGFFIDSGSNAYLSGSFGSKRESLIPLLHFAYSVGALSCGYIVLPFKTSVKWSLGYGITGLVMLSVFFLGFVIKAKTPQTADFKESIKAESVPAVKIFTDRRFIMYCFVIMMYMASQQTCTSWLPLFLEKDFNASNAVTAAATMSFWIGIAAMRLLSPVLLKTGKTNALHSTKWGMLVSFAAMMGIVLSKNAITALVCSAICGFGAGAVVPLFIVETASWYPGNTGLISTVYIVAGTIGRMVFPYLVAFFGDRYGMRIALGASSLLLLAGTVLAFTVSSSKHSRSNE